MVALNTAAVPRRTGELLPDVTRVPGGAAVKPELARRHAAASGEGDLPGPVRELRAYAR